MSTYEEEFRFLYRVARITEMEHRAFAPKEVTFSYEDKKKILYYVSKIDKIKQQESATTLITNLRGGYYIGSIYYWLFKETPTYIYVKSNTQPYYAKEKEYLCLLKESLYKICKSIVTTKTTVILDVSPRITTPKSLYLIKNALQHIFFNVYNQTSEIITNELYFTYEEKVKNIVFIIAYLEHLENINLTQDAKYVILTYIRDKELSQKMDDVRLDLTYPYKFFHELQTNIIHKILSRSPPQQINPCT